MGITYTEQYETRKAHTELSQEGQDYLLDYIATGPVGGTPTEINATLYRVSEEQNVRIGYGYHKDGTTSLRFDDGNNASLSSQSSISTQFYNDLQSILA